MALDLSGSLYMLRMHWSTRSQHVGLQIIQFGKSFGVVYTYILRSFVCLLLESFLIWRTSHRFPTFLATQYSGMRTWFLRTELAASSSMLTFSRCEHLRIDFESSQTWHFCVFKTSRSGEPSWESPLGRIRKMAQVRQRGQGRASSSSDAACPLPSFISLFRCFLFGFSERFFNRMRQKKRYLRCLIRSLLLLLLFLLL